MRAMFTVLIVIGVLATLKWWLLVIVGIPLLAVAAYVLKIHLEYKADTRREHRAELSARADQHLTWVIEGDPRGLYGNYPPAT
jgi:hypothetical protein